MQECSVRPRETAFYLLTVFFVVTFSLTLRRQLLDCGGIHRIMVVTSNSTYYNTKVFNAVSRVRATPF